MHDHRQLHPDPAYLRPSAVAPPPLHLHGNMRGGLAANVLQVPE